MLIHQIKNLVFGTSQLFGREALQIINSYRPFDENRNYPPVLNLQNHKQNNGNFLDKLMVESNVRDFFKSYLKLVDSVSLDGTANGNGTFPFIEDRLKQDLISKIKRSRCGIKVISQEILKTTRIEQAKLKGFFMHRCLNMPRSFYSIAESGKGRIQFIEKGSPSKADVQKYSNIVKKYYDQKFDDIYGQERDHFLKNLSIKRQLFEVEAKIELQVISPSKGKYRIQNRCPTSHLVQIQTFQGTRYQSQQWLTDIDYLLEGNV